MFMPKTISIRPLEVGKIGAKFILHDMWPKSGG
jgi:hypothetical protein